MGQPLSLIHICIVEEIIPEPVGGAQRAHGVLFGNLDAVSYTHLNIAVVTNTLPNTGISLPFFSSGGTSLILLLAEMGVMVNIGRNGERAAQQREQMLSLIHIYVVDKITDANGNVIQEIGANVRRRCRCLPRTPSSAG